MNAPSVIIQSNQAIPGIEKAKKLVGSGNEYGYIILSLLDKNNSKLEVDVCFPDDLSLQMASDLLLGNAKASQHTRTSLRSVRQNGQMLTNYQENELSAKLGEEPNDKTDAWIDMQIELSGQKWNIHRRSENSPRILRLKISGVPYNM